MIKQSKIWGSTSKIFEKNDVSFHKIEIKSGGFCSKHIHKYKFNLFLIEKGSLEIEIWQQNGIMDRTIISEGEMSEIPPSVYHRFRALTDVIAFEIYYTVLLDDDILRDDSGGTGHNGDEIKE